MDKRERVFEAIAHRQTDKVPKGELHIDATLANRILGKQYSTDYYNFERDVEVRKALDIDLINLGNWPSEKIGIDAKGNDIFKSVYGEEYIFNGKSKHITKPALEDIEDADSYVTPDISKVSGDLIAKYVTETDLFVFAQIGGSVSMLNEMLGMEDYLVYCLTNTDEICILAEKVVQYEVAKAKLFIDSGAHAIMFADDIAFNSGALLPPNIMAQVAYPFYKQAVKAIKAYKDVPVFLHTDGNINLLMDDIVKCGFDGLQSLQPSAGMDIAAIKAKYGDKLCLMGNIDLDYILTFAKVTEVEQAVKDTMKAAASGGGFILSSCNILTDIIPAENALAMYNTASHYKE